MLVSMSMRLFEEGYVWKLLAKRNKIVTKKKFNLPLRVKTLKQKGIIYCPYYVSYQSWTTDALMRASYGKRKIHL